MALLASLPVLPTGFDEGAAQPGLSRILLPWDEDEALVVTTTLLALADDGDGDGDGEEAGAGEHKKKKKLSKKEMQKNLVDRDPYKLLDIDDLRWRASAEEVKKAYRKMVLKHHPDKQQGAAAAEQAAAERQAAADGDDAPAPAPPAEDEGDEMFKAVTEAFELLSDRRRRRDFDSLDDFDDSIPPRDFDAKEEDFIGVFGPVFERNSRWSERPNAPLLGGAELAFEEVASFYNFWFDFQSWRDFADADEYDLEDAGYREEKRWMEKQNDKLRAKKRKAEKARIGRLVETAYAHDPRVASYKQGLKDAKAAGKAERAARLEADKAATAAAEAAKAAAAAELAEAERLEARAAKAAKEKAVKAMRKARSRLRGLVKEHGLCDEDAVELLCERLSTAELDALCANADTALAGGGGKAAAVEAAAAAVDRAKAAARAEEEASAASAAAFAAEKAAASAATAKASWTEQELTLLVKGANKFPGGVPDRWERMAEFINHFVEVSGAPCQQRSGDEVANKVRERRRELEVKKAAQPALGEKRPPPPAAPPAPRAPPPAAAAAPVAAAAAAAPKAAPTAPKAAEPADEEAPWSNEQQSALEQALKAIPASVGPDRWDRISDAVIGKTRAECVARYKQIVAALKAKKAAATAAKA